ncbi:MAG: hypothetical protein OXF88_03295 [Rhodobacteraceae bacterium]|nr:hypothetical protein [Paracoccaceae bacterium]MCY4139602.1 hypothetical protein [Paracoccaceae bacterium]
MSGRTRETVEVCQSILRDTPDMMSASLVEALREGCGQFQPMIGGESDPDIARVNAMVAECIARQSGWQFALPYKRCYFRWIRCLIENVTQTDCFGGRRMRKLSMSARDEFLEVLRQRYREAERLGKSRNLDEFVSVSGYHRKHAISSLTLSSDIGLRPRLRGMSYGRPSTPCLRKRSHQRQTVGFDMPVALIVCDRVKPSPW